MPVEVKVFRDLDEVAADAAGALDRAAQPHAHDRLDWFRLTAAHRSGGAPLVLRADDGAGGRAWLFLARGGRRSAEGLALWYTLAFRPVFAGGGDRVAMIAAIARMLRRETVATVDLSPVPVADGSAALLADGFAVAGWWTRVEASSVNWVADVAGRDFAAYWRARPGRLRSTAARKSRANRLAIELHRSFDADAWAAYEQVYAASWKPAEGAPAFLRALARIEGAAGTLRLGVARIEGEPVAAQLWTIENGVATIHKLAHAEAARSLSPGTVLGATMFGAAIDIDHVATIDFGTGDDHYKADWMDRALPLHRVRAADPRQPRGLLAIARATAAALSERMRHGE